MGKLQGHNPLKQSQKNLICKLYAAKNEKMDKKRYPENLKIIVFLIFNKFYSKDYALFK